MKGEQPLWWRIYFDPAYTAVCRAVTYTGITYRRMTELIEDLGKIHGKPRIESAFYHCVQFEGQHTVNPKPLAHVMLRTEVRKLCWQLLGPPPERWDDVYRGMKNPPPNPYGPAPYGSAPKTRPAKMLGEPPPVRPTSLAAQWKDAKERHPGMMLVFRAGDFYELLRDDAEEAAKILGLTLTTRDAKIPMAGFPHHQS